MQTNKKNIDFVIIVPPMSLGPTVYPPYGAMYIASALRQKGYEPHILNIDTDRLTNEEIIERIRKINPKYIGFSGIVAPSYQYIKELSLELRRTFPDKKQILGGGLSSAAEPVLKNTAIDIVVRGEGDTTIIELMDCLEKKNNLVLKDVRGIYYKDGQTCVYTGMRKLIMNLDTLPYPAFDLVDMDRYLQDGPQFIQNLTKGTTTKRLYTNREKRKMITIPTSRGCFNECTFCFRAYRGLRVHSMKYVFDFIEYCIEKFNVGFFSLGDECFAPTKKRNWDFIEEYKKRNLDIVFRIFGMRVDTVDPEILNAYREIGCWMIEYGFESGSQKMLNIINKRVSVEQNRSAALWTRDAGIHTSPALILAMPGETTETIGETIDFLKSLNFNFRQYQWKYAIPIPGSQLYDFAKLTGAIENEDKYLSWLTGEAGEGAFTINLTDEPDDVVAEWATRIENALDEYCFRTKYRIKNRLIAKLVHFFMMGVMAYKQGRLGKAAVRKAKAFSSFIFNISRKTDVQKKYLRFRKKKDVKIEEFVKGIDCSRINTEMSLKNINKKLCEIEV